MPTYDKAIQKYFADKQAYDHQQVSSEGNVRRAFGNLLQDTAKTQKWTLIEEHVMKKSGGRKIRVDGVLKDNWQLPYGYWEAKDSKDDLQKEITQKILVGYPTSNIIFEDTRQAVLYQHDERVFTADLTDPKQIGELLQLFYQYSQPDFQGFENAVLDFQAKIPDLGERLKTLLQTAHQSNKKFQAAYTQFFDLCQQSLNPNISREAVDEMLIQHRVGWSVLFATFVL